MNKYYAITSLFIAVLLVSSCGGSSESSPQAEIKSTGILNLGITDAPVDDAAKVNVQFTGVEIQSESGDLLTFSYDEVKNIDLLALQGGGSENLLTGITLESGRYSWIRLLVNAERNTLDSYLEHSDGNQVSLWVPSGAQSGLKLNSGFTMTAGNTSNFTIDFDLRKSITDPRGQIDYYLRPSLRLIDNNEAGEIMGTVDADLLTAEGCSEIASVYVFNEEVGIDGVDDIDLAAEGEDDLGGPDPITTATVTLAQDEVYQYTAAFLSAGDYVIALTCQAGFDDSSIDNDDEVTNNGQTIEFIEATIVTVIADTTTEYHFVANP